MNERMISSTLLKGVRSIGNRLSLGNRFKLPRSVLRRLFRFVNNEVCVSDFDGALQLRLRLSEHMQRRIFWMGYYSTDVVVALKQVLKPGMVVLDVGANIGEITLVAANLVKASGKVIAFEPVNAIAERLSEHIASNHLKQVIVRRLGLGATAAEGVPIYASCGQPSSDENHGLASLYGGQENNAPIDHINVTTLDAEVEALGLQRVDLIKIDIEGAEMACLQGANRTLQKFKPMLIVEVQDYSATQAGWCADELFNYLSGFGYSFFTIGRKGRLQQMDPSALADFQNVFCMVENAPLG